MIVAGRSRCVALFDTVPKGPAASPREFPCFRRSSAAGPSPFYRPLTCVSISVRTIGMRLAHLAASAMMFPTREGSPGDRGVRLALGRLISRCRGVSREYPAG